MTEAEAVKQIKFILDTEKALGISKASVMARMLQVNYKVYSKWRNGENEMPAIAYAAFRMVVAMRLAKATNVQAMDLWIDKISNALIF